MEAFAKGISMGLTLLLFMLAFLTAQEYRKKSEALLNKVDQLRNAQAVMTFQEEDPL